MDSASPLVSVIIPNWIGVHLLPTCLNALRRQSFRNFETIVVDNGSTDGSLALLKNYPEVKVIALKTNSGFAYAVNLGIHRSQAPLVALLNNDTEAEPQWLAELVKTLEENPEVDMVASKLLLYDQRHILHSAGDFYGRGGVPGNRGVWEEDRGQYDGLASIFGPCAGAAAYRRRLFRAIGLFDEDFIGYCEDVDFNFRAQLAGYKALFAPKARVYHQLSASGGGVVASYFCGRNFINILVKNMPTNLFKKYWRKILVAQLRYLVQSLRHFGEPAARARLRGQWAALPQLPCMLAKRRTIQAQRRVTDAYIDSIMSAEGDLR
ncbi:MAG: glycosyltransferase family 2 protein [Chloroflexi bacterium]|nr:glycosyltransferase family 2 protein [Chloroflexota bacterium]